MAVRDTTARIYPASFLEGRCPLRHDGSCALPPQHFDDLTMVFVITRLRKSRSDLSRHPDILPYAMVWKGLCSVNPGAMHLLRCSPQALSCRCTPAALWSPGRGRQARSRQARQHSWCHGRPQAAGRYRSPFASKPQATRAVLLAWAPPARFFPRRTMRPWSQRLRPSCLPSTVRTTDRAPWMSNFRRERSPRLLIPSNSGLPPVECCRGTTPSHAANSRPFLNVVASPTAPTKAVAVKGPTPSSCASL